MKHKSLLLIIGLFLIIININVFGKTTIIDDFNDNSFNNSMWRILGSPTINENTGTLSISGGAEWTHCVIGKLGNGSADNFMGKTIIINYTKAAAGYAQIGATIDSASCGGASTNNHYGNDWQLTNTMNAFIYTGGTYDDLVLKSSPPSSNYFSSELTLLNDGKVNIVLRNGTNSALINNVTSNRTLNNVTYYIFLGSYSSTLQVDSISINDNIAPQSATNFTITNINNYNNASITNFSALINGTQYNTTIGTITTPFLTNSTSLFNITIISNNMFNKTYINYNISTNLQATQYQSVINFTIINNITGQQNYNNFTLKLNNTIICNQNQNTSCIGYPNEGTYTLNLTPNNGIDFIPVLQNVTITALDNKTINISVFDHYLNITAINGRNNSNITNFNITIQDTNNPIDLRYYNTTTSSILIPVIHSTYNITLTPPTYITTSQLLIIDTNLSAPQIQNLTITTWKINAVNIAIYDLNTLQYINNNVTLKMIGVNNYYTYLITNGTFYVDGLANDVYQSIFTLNLTGYQPVQYYLTLGGNAFYNLTAYFQINLQTIIFNTKDATNQISMPNTLLNIYQNVNGSSNNIASCISDYQGQCIAYLNPTIEYVLYATHTGFQNFNGKITPVLNNYNINMQPLGTIDIGQDYFTSINVINNLYYQNNAFFFNYNDSSNTITKGCINVYSNNALFNSSCVNGSNNIFSVGITNMSDAYYVAQGIVYINNQSWIMKTSNYHYDKLPLLSLDTKFLFLFIDLLLTLLFGLLFFYNISVALIITPLPTLFLSLFSMIPINRGAGITLFLIGLTLAFVIRKRS